jgi:hypothetical protein
VAEEGRSRGLIFREPAGPVGTEFGSCPRRVRKTSTTIGLIYWRPATSNSKSMPIGGSSWWIDSGQPHHHRVIEVGLVHVSPEEVVVYEFETEWLPQRRSRGVPLAR